LWPNLLAFLSYFAAAFRAWPMQNQTFLMLMSEMICRALDNRRMGMFGIFVKKYMLQIHQMKMIAQTTTMMPTPPSLQGRMTRTW
jgi:hypothetical protein